jgi:hypothetical protein
MGLWTRILGRYLVGAVIGLLAYAGLPADLVAAVKDDPEITAGVTLVLAALIEWVTVQARRRGWLT